MNMKIIILLAFVALSKGAPRPSDDDHVVNKPIGHDDVHIPDDPEIEDIISHKKDGPRPEGIIPDEPEREDIISHEDKNPLLGRPDGHDGHTTEKHLLGQDGHGIRFTTSEPDASLHGGIIYCATGSPSGPKDESLFNPFGQGRTIIPPFVDPDLSRGRLPGDIKIADIIKDHAKKTSTSTSTKILV